MIDAPDIELRQAWDAALTEALTPAPSLHERAEALDYELSRCEAAARLGYIANGRVGFNKDAVRRIAALRALLDMLFFFEKHAKDAVLSRRIRELKQEEERR